MILSHKTFAVAEFIMILCQNNDNSHVAYVHNAFEQISLYKMKYGHSLSGPVGERGKFQFH